MKGKPANCRAPLFGQVTNILEWPFALVGEFSDDYLKLPETLSKPLWAPPALLRLLVC